MLYSKNVDFCPSEVQLILCALKNGLLKNTEREEECEKEKTAQSCPQIG
jgi:hypothetical protein